MESSPFFTLYVFSCDPKLSSAVSLLLRMIYVMIYRYCIFSLTTSRLSLTHVTLYLSHQSVLCNNSRKVILPNNFNISHLYNCSSSPCISEEMFDSRRKYRFVPLIASKTWSIVWPCEASVLVLIGTHEEADIGHISVLGTWTNSTPARRYGSHGTQSHPGLFQSDTTICYVGVLGTQASFAERIYVGRKFITVPRGMCWFHPGEGRSSS